ncbi:MAG: UDP-N-acetylmuramoyl-L-alanyl-D-glutamate--2,6-diaminopimelate ligase [Actinomycetes bacterium]
MAASPLPRPTVVARPLREAGHVVPGLGDTPDVLITGISLDSRTIRPGDLYAALPGANHHGASFVRQAAQNGAAVVLTDPVGAQLIGQDYDLSAVPQVIVADPRSLLGALSAWTYGYPAREMAVVGITGTDGKTTTAMLLEAALQAAGHRTGLIGTVVTRIADEEIPAARTTPEATDLHALLAVMRERGVTAVAMEVSSHALALGRVDAVDFDVAVFTNLGHDHLDFHADQESYFQAKASLFTPARSRRGLVCVDDQWGRRLLSEAQIPVQSYSVAEAGQDDLAYGVPADWQGCGLLGSGVGFRYQLQGPAGLSVTGATALAGVFNVRNSVAAAAAAITLGSDPQTAVDGIEYARAVPGRMEPIVEGQPFVVLVDYAHTPDAVSRALSVGQELAVRNGGRLIALLGCGGDRDKAKRPLMGAVAARLADVVVVTDDNPRSERPEQIREQIMAGAVAQVQLADADRSWVELLDRPERQRALQEVVQMAHSGDVVMALGKGHERGQEIGGTVYPLDDREILRSAIRSST